MKNVLALLVFCSVIGCNRENSNLHDIIDVGYAIDNSEDFDINKYVNNVKYVPLETNENCFIAEVRKVVINADYILVSDSQENLFLFNSRGGFIRRIGSIGKSPSEYFNMTDFVVDSSFTNIYISCLGYIAIYDIEGRFKNKLSIDSGNLQVLCIDNSNRLYYIMPNTVQKDGTDFPDLVLIFDQNGKLLKTVKSHEVRTEGKFTYFNSIYSKNDEVFYKEEFGEYIYRINSALDIDSAYQIILGKYAFEPEDFVMSKKDTWESHYRLHGIFSFDRFLFLNMQKGLIGKSIEVIIYDKKKRNVIYPSNDSDSKKKGIHIEGIRLVPIADYNDELVCIVSSEDIFENKDFIISDLATTLAQMNENSNPLLAILKINSK